MKFALVCIALLVSVATGMVGAADEQLQTLLHKPFVKAEFVKERKLKVLSRPFVTSGILLFEPGKGVIWHTTQPVEDIVLINNAGIKNIGATQDALSANLAQNPVMKGVARLFLALFSLDPDSIRREFDVTPATPVGAALHYRLSVRDSNLAAFIEEIQLRGEERISEISITEKSGDSTVIKLSNELFDRQGLSNLERELLGQL